MRLDYAEQPNPEGLAQAFLIGADFLAARPARSSSATTSSTATTSRRPSPPPTPAPAGATIFGYQVANPSAYGVVEFAEDGRVLSLEEKPEKPRSNFAIPGHLLLRRRGRRRMRAAFEALEARRARDHGPQPRSTSTRACSTPSSSAAARPGWTRARTTRCSRPPSSST